MFNCETRVPNDVCESFVTNEMNKTKLNEFIIWKFVGSNSWKHQYCVTNGTKNVITEAGQTSIYDSSVVNSVLEEADNRIVCHISDIISKEYSKIGPQKPGGWGGCSPPQIFAKVDLLPIDNYSEKKKIARKI